MTLTSHRKIRRAIVGGSVFLALATLWFWVPAGPLEKLTLDNRYHRSNRDMRASDQVVVIDIDDQSLKSLATAYGRWPWPRRLYKDLVEFLAVGEPAIILFDILFTERMGDGSEDAMLGEASRNAGVVSHAFTFLKEPAETRYGINPLPAEFKRKFALRLESMPMDFAFRLPVYRDYEVPPDAFVNLIPRSHAVTIELDRDGRFRNTPLLFNYDGDWYPSLALSGILATRKNPKLRLQDDEIIIESDGKIPLYLPIDEKGMLPLHYYTLDRAPAAIPIDSVLSSAAKLQAGLVGDPTKLAVNPMEFKGKVVLIGGSASGLQDLKATPLHPSYPGALLQATAISNALLNDHLYRFPNWVSFLIVLAGLIVIYGTVFTQPGTIGRIGLPLLLGFAFFGFSHYLFKNFSIALDMARPALTWTGAFLDAIAYLIFIETAERRKLKETLSKYLSPVVTERLMSSGIDPQAEIGHGKELSILFSDIRGFTSISEALPPEKIVECLNSYLSRMNEIIFRHLGTVDKFIGDGLMAFWGAPLEDPLHSVRAVRCGLDMLAAMDEVRETLRRKFGLTHELAIGIGINTGTAIVGNIGSAQHLSYTAIGDNVNLASRVEGITKQYHVPFLIGEKTYEAVKQSIICRLIDDVQVKGKSQHVRIYQPLAERSAPNSAPHEELAHQFEKAWLAYGNGDFKIAQKLFTETAERFANDGPSLVYRDRCEQLIAQPPENWSVIHVHQSK